MSARVWPTSDEGLLRAQADLAGAAAAVLATEAWSLPADPLIGGCFAAYRPRRVRTRPHGRPGVGRGGALAAVRRRRPQEALG